MKIICLAIAGFDGSGGAGIQADLKTFAALGCYGTSVLTAFTVQNTCGVRGSYELPWGIVSRQLEAIFDDIRPNSIKIEMLYSSEIIREVVEFLEIHALDIPIIVDSVMVSKSGALLLQAEAIKTLKTKFANIATLITPNLPEAATLLGIEKIKFEMMEESALSLLDYGSKAVLLKGGHLEGLQSSDLFLSVNEKAWIESLRINSKNIHGTGCTLSSAICAYMAQGLDLLETVKAAKVYVLSAIKASTNKSIGRGNGPLYHSYKFFS